CAEGVGEVGLTANDELQGVEDDRLAEDRRVGAGFDDRPEAVERRPRVLRPTGQEEVVRGIDRVRVHRGGPLRESAVELAARLVRYRLKYRVAMCVSTEAALVLEERHELGFQK